MSKNRNLILLPVLACLLGYASIAQAQELPAPVRLASGWQLQDVAKVSEAGEALSRASYHAGGWYRATVPGTVLTSLVNDGVFPEPLYGENNRPDKIPESLCHTAYWYRTSFRLPASYAGKRIWLNFHGINYTADVWVNGHPVGSIHGAFARGVFDVTADVAAGAANVLAVRVTPQPHPGVVREQTVANGTGPNGGETARDGATFLSTVGWDWIPGIRDRDTGIWQDVDISATGPVTIADPYVVSDLPLPRTDTADLTVQTTLRNATDQPQTGDLTGVVAGKTFREKITLGARETRTLTLSPATTPVLRLQKPKLWWPNGYGPANLYTLHLRFDAGGAVSDSRDVRFGVRKITYAVPGSDNLTLSVNGVPIIAKGGDWGMDEAMKRIPPARLDAQVHMHQLANYTMIRNWVGQSTSEAFYDACDKYGILVWDEFFQPNPSDGPDPDDVPMYLDNVREKILRFRSHPSIALWCARNEGDPTSSIGVGIQQLVTALDPGRLYQASSGGGRGIASGGPYQWRPPRAFYSYGEAFKTEIGSMSVPTLESVHAMMPAQDWEVINDDWAEHDFCSGAQAGDRYPNIITSRYGPIASLADFVRKAQLANYECFRAMYEGRFARLFHPSTGVLTWMSNPSQPSFVWQIYSHDLEPNASLYGARKACEPVHIQMNQNDWHVTIVNNTPQALDGLTARTIVYNLDGAIAYDHTDKVAAPASAAADAGAIAFPADVTPVHFVQLELRDAHGRPLSTNFYWRNSAANKEDVFTALNSLPTVPLEVKAVRRGEGANCLLDVTVRNPTRSVALLAHFQLRRARTGERVLPVFYGDNYISLAPGEQRSFTVEAATADLGGEAPLLAVDGWNVTAQPVTSGVAVLTNKEALVVSPSETTKTNAVADTISINCGGTRPGFFRFGPPPAGAFTADSDFTGGQTQQGGYTVDTSAPGAAIPAVYQSARWGECAYTIPLPPNQRYTVRLHFAEYIQDPGERKFNVDINGRRVLTDLDVAAEAGQRKALVKDFSDIAPDANGHIVIRLSRGSAAEPRICGIQIAPSGKPFVRE